MIQQEREILPKICDGIRYLHRAEKVQKGVLPDRQMHWLTVTDSQTHRLTDSLTDWLTYSLTDSLTDSLNHWLTKSLCNDCLFFITSHSVYQSFICLYKSCRNIVWICLFKYLRWRRTKDVIFFHITHEHVFRLYNSREGGKDFF